MGKIVSIHSFRGGTGKSNLTANLAAQAAMNGKRVGMMDTDIQSPGIHVLFGLTRDTIGNTINDYLKGECSIDDVAFSVGEHPSDVKGVSQLAGKDLWLLPASMNTKEISDFVNKGYDPNILNEGMQTFIKNKNLDYLFIDTHPGVNEETLLSVVLSDILIIILRPDQQDFQGTAVVVDIAQLLDVPQLYLVVNKALSKYDFAQVKETVESSYNVPVAGVLPLTEDLVELGSSDLLTLSDPDHTWSKTVIEIARQIMEAK